jgi:hypothetical protein
MMMTPFGYKQGGLNATYFNSLDLNAGTIAAARIDGNVNFDWKFNSAASGVVADNFSARWNGKYRANATGWHTFSTLADDGVRLSIGGNRIIDNWRDHSVTEDRGQIWLEAGNFYDLNLEYYDSGYHATIKLFAEGPGFSKKIVDGSQLFHQTNNSSNQRPSPTLTPVSVPTLAPNLADMNLVDMAQQRLLSSPDTRAEERFGLVTTIYGRNAATGTEMLDAGITQKADFNWADRAPSAGMSGDQFTITMGGRIAVQNSGWYTFTTKADDRVSLQINDQTIINTQGVGETSGGIWLESGKLHNLYLSYSEDFGFASLNLSWSGVDTGNTRQTFTGRNALTYNDRLPYNITTSNMFEAFDRTNGGDPSQLKEKYRNPNFI